MDEIEAIFEETDAIKDMIEQDELEIEAEESDLDVLLNSCGILSTTPTHVLSTLVQTRKSKSLDMVHLLAQETHGHHQTREISRQPPKSPKMLLRMMKENVVAASMTRSLDFDDMKVNRRVVSEGFSGKQVKVGLPAFQELLQQEYLDTSSISSDSETDLVPWAEQPLERNNCNNKPTFFVSKHDEPDVTEKKSALQEKSDETSGETSALASEVTAVDSSQEVENSETVSVNGVPAEEVVDESEDKFPADDAQTQSKHSKPVMALYHPSMKMSLR